jgi:hypothetical protein
VCLDKEDKNVYSNVTKFIQLVVWTCMHPENSSSGTRLPFHFAWDEAAMKSFFNAPKIKGQGWMAINEEEKKNLIFLWQVRRTAR